MKSARTVKLLSIAGGLTVLLLVVLCGVQIPGLNTKYSVKQFFPKNHPILKQEDDVYRQFQLRESPAFFAVVELPKGQKGTWLEPRRMARLDAVTKRFAGLQGVKTALSIANVEMAVHKRDELRIGTLRDTVPVRKWKEYVASQALLQPQLISKDGRSVMIVIEPRTGSSTGLTKLEARIHGILKKDLKSFETGLAGVPAVQSRLSQKLQTEVGRFFALCMIIFCAMFALFYRNFTPVLFAAVGLVVCNVAVLGVLSALQVSFTVLLSTLPIIVSIAFVSLAIHTMHLWADRLVEAGSPTDIVTRWNLSLKTLREIALGNFLGSLTTAIGFLTLTLAPIPAIRDYALIIALSVMGAFGLTQFGLMMALPWLTPVQRSWTRKRAWWTLAVTRWSGTVFVVGIGVTVFMGGAGLELNFSSKLFDDLPAKEKIHHAMSRIDRQFGGTVALDFTVDAGHRDAWSDPGALRRLEMTLASIRRVEGVGSALGLTDFMVGQKWSSRGAVAEIFFLFSMAAENPLRNYVDNSFRRARISIRLPDLPSGQIARMRAEVRDIVKTNFPRGKISETGLAVNSHTINHEVAKELVFGFWQSLAIIGLLLVFVFRSLRWALVACIPNLVPPAVLIGALAFFQTPVKPSIALIFSIALGLAFNNTVYLLTKLRRLRLDKKMSTLPLRRTLLEEGNPCLSESLLTCAGFVIFLSSDFQLNQTFGAYMVLSIVAGALGDLVFLPALLKLFPEIMGRGPAAEKPPKDESQPPGENRRGESDAVVPPAAAAAFLGFLILTSGFSSPVLAAPSAKAILKKSLQKIEARTDQATVKLKIIEANGDVKTRQLQLKTLQDGGTYHALVRIQSPANIKGTALLAEVKDGTENQWLYLPSSRQVRRIVAAKSSGGVLGSELNPEDLNAAALRGSAARVVKRTTDRVWIEVKPRKGTSAYSRALLTLSMPEYLPEQVQYFSGKKIKKTVEFKDYVSPDGKVQRARKIIVKNLANRRGTEVEFSDLKVNAPLKASDFSVSALKKGR